MTTEHTTADPTRNEPRPRTQRTGATRVPADGAPARAGRRWQDVTTLMLGAFLFLSPFFTVATLTYVVDAFVVGGLISLVSVWALAVPSSRAAEVSNALLGTGLFLAPWLLGFVSLSATWTAWIVGAVVAVLALSALPRAGRLERRRREPRAA